MTENKTPASTPEDKITIIEKNLHRTNLQRLKDTLCLFFPIAAAFAGCLLADPLAKGRVFPLETVLTIAKGALTGLTYLHSQAVLTMILRLGISCTILRTVSKLKLSTWGI